MRKWKYLGSFFVAFIFGIFVMSNFSELNIANNISNVGKGEQETYYEDENGNVWASKEEYLEYTNDEYFVAPDGTYWQNEYRYQQSLK